MNRVFLFGKLSFDPNKLQTRTNNIGASFSLACIDSSGFNDSKSYIRITAWGKVASFVLTLKPGDSVFVEGRLSTYKMNNRSDDPNSKATYALQVIADKVYRPDEENSLEQPVDKATVIDSPFLAAKTNATENELAQAFPISLDDEDDDINPILNNDSQLEEESDDE
ncbi:single-stranded DNA-binding protein [Mycoplasmoides pneumoniae]|uniref:Single-stranded DNA-binding protein n=4 Tax=Mycoplasmoides pneumoniae TaxID=2104 RepID=SSB_MYCPN|nr:single-stranded DNA-binding protein [Mycoplasmoides pneumoniae]P75542.1 RecName: Full=Single-stranded DNA-binding protein; Short=SSB [Mycoplasmoides pneumoniae M129]AAB96250.1 single-stranded DNA binding protein [Mycoplasmoides pneumoniae M129]ADK86698.1 single-strand binding family protein [Mycoplasmoides pneumoniae FH]AGC04154.1 single-stranded DNA-binding protein [Mycoplasmoides pneumoniae M129-B7]ALA30112.1 single-stranded DNA-binding protein [Mycoplasmoides pneumoniae PI 1428]ALA31066